MANIWGATCKECGGEELGWNGTKWWCRKCKKYVKVERVKAKDMLTLYKEMIDKEEKDESTK